MFEKERNELVLEFINDIQNQVNISFDKMLFECYEEPLFISKKFHDIREQYINKNITIDEYMNLTNLLIKGE